MDGMTVEPVHTTESTTIFHGDCREVMAGMEPDSVDCIVTDPPYGLSKEPDMAEVLRHWLADRDYEHAAAGFMGKSWDSFVPGPNVWREACRVLKPGGHMLVFAGTRTLDLMGISLRLAGFEYRDTCMFLYGSGFPKSLDASKAIDKMLGADRPVIGKSTRHGGGVNHIYGVGMGDGIVPDLTAPGTPEATQWSGFGTALKPAWEPIILARKPLVGTVAANVLEHGTGALNIDGCRIVGVPDQPGSTPATSNGNGVTHGSMTRTEYAVPVGRWPSNVLLSHDPECVEVGATSIECVSGCPVRLLDEQSGACPGKGGTQAGWQDAYVGGSYSPITKTAYSDKGGASRFFYTAKASKAERNLGLPEGTKSDHPTVKPLGIMKYLTRLVCPPGGVLLDPFMGSGTTGVAAVTEGFQFVGIEQDEHYIRDIAVHRLEYALGNLPDPSLFD